MTPTVPSDRVRRALYAVCSALIIVQLARLLPLMPDWVAGLPERSPGRRVNQALSAVGSIALMTSAILNLSTRTVTAGPARRRRQVGVWAMLAIAVGTLAIEIAMDFANPN